MGMEMVRGRLAMAARAGLIGLGVATLGAGAVWAKADLVVVERDSEVEAGSCATDKPLATGRIAIRNNGTEKANLRGGIVSRLGRSMVAVYQPEHPDMFDGATEFVRLDRNEQQVIKFTLGQNDVKKGRFGAAGSGASDSSALDLNALSRDAKRNIQQSLKDLGHYSGAIDGLLGAGYRRAASAFQKSIGATDTGALTVGQARELGRKTNRELVGGGGSGPVKVTLYAVVDPYNLADEEDETNNLVKFEITINCD